MFIYFWESARERQSGNGEGRDREGDTESEAGSRLWAVSTDPEVGLELTNREIMTWAEVGRLTDWATQVPPSLFIFGRDGQSMSGGGAEREGDTESEAGSRLWGISTEPDTGLELTFHEIMTWVEVGHLTDWATQAPQLKTILNGQSQNFVGLPWPYFVIQCF